MVERDILNLSSPNVAISSALIKRKDPISAWEFDPITGITSSVEFKALTKEEPILLLVQVVSI